MSYTVKEAKEFDDEKVAALWPDFWVAYVAEKGWSIAEAASAEEQLHQEFPVPLPQGWEAKRAMLAYAAVDAAVEFDGELYDFEQYMPAIVSPVAIVNARSFFTPNGERPTSSLTTSMEVVTVRDIVKLESLQCGVQHKVAEGDDGQLHYVAVGRFRLPVCQRDFVWSVEQCQTLVDSLMRKMPMGTLVATKIQRPPLPVADVWGISTATLSATSNMLIDGQQRSTALCAYVSGVYPVYGQYFHELPEELRNEFLDMPVPVATIDDIPLEQLLELYDRLSAGGTAHLNTEKAMTSLLRALASGTLMFGQDEDGVTTVTTTDGVWEVDLTEGDVMLAQSASDEIRDALDDAEAAKTLGLTA